MTDLREAARALGEKGATPTEEERLLFEAWMEGHCWKVCGQWNGLTYVNDDETISYADPDAMRTRQLWAAWRDRAALAAEEGRVSVPREWLDVLVSYQAGRCYACDWPLTTADKGCAPGNCSFRPNEHDWQYQRWLPKAQLISTLGGRVRAMLAAAEKDR